MLTLLLFAALSSPWHDHEYTERSEYTQSLAAHGRLSLRNEIGEIRIRTSDRRDVRVVAIKRYRTNNDAEGAAQVKQLRVNVTRSEGEVRVVGEWPSRDFSKLLKGQSNLQLDLELDIPRDARIDVRNNIGDIKIEGAGSDVDVTENIGEVRIEGTFRPRVVRLETDIGEVMTNLSGKTSGFLGKKFTAILPGENSVNVRLHIGEITVHANGNK